MIIALSGRRVDAVDAKQPRFPLQNVPRVKSEVSQMLRSSKATAVVSSAACGADLIALAEAGSLGLRRRVILPFSRERFRETSVVDRPGDWGSIYNQVMNEVEAAGDLVVLNRSPDDDPYGATNQVILNEASALASQAQSPLGALLMWEGTSRGGDDFTASFGNQARKLGAKLYEILTN